MKRIVILFTLVFTIFLRNAFGSDAWIKPAPAGKDLLLLSAAEFFTEGVRIKPPSRSSAIALLKSISFLEISSKQALEISSVKSTQKAGSYYLLRGVSLDEAGKFIVYQKGEDTLVYFKTMGTKGKSLSRCPIVVRLPRKPQNLFVMASTDE